MLSKMKILNLIGTILSSVILCSCSTTEGYKQNEITSKTIIKKGIAESEFTVWGNCDMCKETIEKAVNKNGVLNANWNVETKIMKISYDTSQISLKSIQKYIADAGYDNVKFKGNEAAYKKLHECCKYKRK